MDAHVVGLVRFGSVWAMSPAAATIYGWGGGRDAFARWLEPVL